MHARWAHGDRLDTISAGWLATALGYPSPDAVEEVSVEVFGGAVGILAGVARARFRTAADGVARSVVVKVPASDERSRQVAESLDMNRREVSFYRSMAADSPLRPPQAHVAALDDDARGFVLVLEDLGALRAQPQVDRLTIDDVSRAIDALAAHHALHWGVDDDPGAGELPRIDNPPMSDVLPAQLGALWPRFHAEYGERVGPVGLQFGERLLDRLDDLTAALAEPPLTVCHGDYRPDNLFFDDAAGTVRAIDFQLVGRSRGGRDLGYLLVQSLGRDQRAASERALVERYRAALDAHGVSIDADRAWHDYRLGAAFAFVYAVVAAVGIDPADPGARRLVECMVDGARDVVIDLDLVSVFD